MIWKKCILQKRRKVGEDALRNPVYDWVDIMTTKARHTPWTDEQISLEGREVTRNEQQFIIPIRYEAFPRCQRAVINGILQEVTDVSDASPRWTIIRVKTYKE